jgi:small subunit ribosomal protein S3
MSSMKNVIKDNYNMMLLKDYLKEKVKEAGFSHVDISKTPTGTRVLLHVTRPGIVIGRKGTGIRELTETMEKRFGLKAPQIEVKEIAQPELTASVMCNRLSQLIQRGTAFRRATMWTLQQIMNAGAMGVQITVSGKLRGDRSSFEKHSLGILPRAGHSATIIVDEDTAPIPTAMGYIGVRIRIARKEKYTPEFELKGKKETKEEREIRIAKEESDRIARTESEQVKIDQEKIEKMDLMEEVEEKLK